LKQGLPSSNANPDASEDERKDSNKGKHNQNNSFVQFDKNDKYERVLLKSVESLEPIYEQQESSHSQSSISSYDQQYKNQNRNQKRH
jgi:hypothetical protein